MAESEPDWNLYRTLLAVVRGGSFSAAARLTGTTQPTVGRQIDSLETKLGAKLFTRSQRGLVPTPAARQLMPHAEAMAAAAAALRRDSTAVVNEETGTVRLTAGAQVGIEILPPILAEFSREHPKIELELSISSRHEDLLRRDADIAVRMARPTQRALIAQHLGKLQVGLFAHRSYVDTHGAPRTLSDLTRHRLIGFDRDERRLEVLGGLGARLRREDFSFRADNVTAQLALLRAGLGIAACPVNVARRELDLVPILVRDVLFEREMWLVMHSDLKKSRRIRLLFDHLARALNGYLRADRRHARTHGR